MAKRQKIAPVPATSSDAHTFQAILPINPLPASRPRFRVVKLRSGKFFVHTYTDAPYKAWLAEFNALWVEKPFEKFNGPVRVELAFDVQKPRTSKLLYPKPDVDNYAKAVMDGLTQIGMWGDDSQVVELRVMKRFVPHDPVVNNGVIHLRITPQTVEEISKCRNPSARTNGCSTTSSITGTSPKQSRLTMESAGSPAASLT